MQFWNFAVKPLSQRAALPRFLILDHTVSTDPVPKAQCSVRGCNLGRAMPASSDRRKLGSGDSGRGLG